MKMIHLDQLLCYLSGTILLCIFIYTVGILTTVLAGNCLGSLHINSISLINVLSLVCNLGIIVIFSFINIGQLK